MIVVVTGGREFFDKKKVYETLDSITAIKPITFLYEGGAKGADSLAAYWRKERNIGGESIEAEWDKYKKAAGHIRNQKMLDEFKPDLVIAFPGGTGTADMIERTKKAKIPLVEIK